MKVIKIKITFSTRTVLTNISNSFKWCFYFVPFNQLFHYDYAEYL